MPYDVLILSTGSSYLAPFKNDGMQTTAEERKAEFDAVRTKVKEAESILVVGGGPNGVENAAYLKEFHPEK